MHTLQKQQGMATVLLVLLIGITVMLITAAVAKTLVTNREAGVSAHAQTNVQMMGWAGVSAFRQYLLKQGQIQASNIVALNGRSVPLRSRDNQEITAKNIRVNGCVTEGATCTVTADISSNNKASQAATTIEATYNLELKDGTVSVAGQTSSINLSGNTLISGTALEAEVPNSKVTVNIDGYTSIQAGFTTKNISELTINSTGNVDIDCSVTKCGNTKIHINAQGYVHIVNPGTFGDINATKGVWLTTGVKADNISSLEEVNLTTNSSANTVKANGNVLLTNASAGAIFSNGNVNLNTTSSASSISTLGNIMLSLSTVNGNIESAGHINISASTVKGDARAYEYVDLDSFSTVEGSVYAKGQDTIGLYKNAVRLSTSKILGNVYANGDLALLGGDEIKGNVFVRGDIHDLNILSTAIKGTKTTNKPVANLDFKVTSAINVDATRQYIQDKVNFETKVDVRVYKQEANYIFTSTNGFNRVYLNKLKNKSNSLTYMYINGKQYEVDTNGVSTEVNSVGFAIGDYKIGNNTYIGAICKTASQQGKCTSDIIGYLPRISVGKTLGIDNDYDTDLLGIWYIRSTSAKSPIDNATLAPGIMYFDGKVIIAGNANWGADSMSNVFTNSFLAEGSIDAIAVSPRIYSPYNIVREGDAALICDRTLKTINNSVLDITTTNPTTVSNKYLVPTNLCKNDNEFSFNMNKNSNGDRVAVEIDGKSIPKLDLGYVALMSNNVIRIGACAQIFGDVLARGTIEGTAGCGITKNPNAITGNISTQGEGGLGNAFTAGSKIVVPNPNYTNAKDIPASTTSTGLTAESSKLQWSKYL